MGRVGGTRKYYTEQAGADVGVLATALRGGKCGEAELGDWKNEDQKPATYTADRKLSGEDDFYTITIGSAVIRVRIIKTGLYPHF